MIYVDSLLLVFCSTIGLLLRYAPFAPLATPRQKKMIAIWFSVISVINYSVLLYLEVMWKIEGMFLYLRFGMLIYASVLTVVSILIFNGKIREHLFVFGVVSSCNYLLLTIPNFLVTLFQSLTATQYADLILISFAALMAAAYVPMKRMLCNAVTPFLQLDAGVYWNTIWFIPIALLCTRLLNVGGEHNTGGLQQLLSSGLSGSVIILICLNLAKDNRRVREHQVMERQLLEQEMHYNALQTHVEDTRKARHDLKHHMAAILHCVEQNDRKGARQYCQEMMARAESNVAIPYTGNTAADGVLYHYMQQALDRRIVLENMGTIRSPGIADVDLCVLLGNALDNAIAGCLTIADNRNIQVISQSEDQLLSIMVRNTYDGQVEQDQDGLLSRKRDHGPGVGLRSMQAVCDRYGGSMDIHYDESTFTVIFALPLGE